MAKIKVILCDEEGNQIQGVKAKDYALEVGNQTLDEIEAAVEEFKLKALPELESDLLNVAQAQLTQQVKKKMGSLQRKNRSHHQNSARAIYLANPAIQIPWRGAEFLAVEGESSRRVL